jgi:4-carboxymuconolactone decarboxylase
MTSDIDPHSGFRLPLLRRDELDEAGQATYDRAARGDNVAGLRGPAGVSLYSRGAHAHLRAMIDYLRTGADIPARVREVALLATEREFDNQFQWSLHEAEARKVAVPQDTIDAIKHRRSTVGLDETDALVITFARQLWRDHKVTSEIFAQANALFGPHRLVDLVVLMGNHAATAALLTAVDMQLPDGTEPPLPMT